MEKLNTFCLVIISCISRHLHSLGSSAAENILTIQLKPLLAYKYLQVVQLFKFKISKLITI